MPHQLLPMSSSILRCMSRCGIRPSRVRRRYVAMFCFHHLVRGRPRKCAVAAALKVLLDDYYGVSVPSIRVAKDGPQEEESPTFRPLKPSVLLPLAPDSTGARILLSKAPYRLPLCHQCAEWEVPSQVSTIVAVAC
jgi:hypothetical protein